MIDLFPTTLSFFLHLLELRHQYGDQLHEDRSGDVRHDAQSKDGGLIKSTTREGIDESEDTGVVLGTGLHGLWIDTGKHDVCPDSIDQDHQKGEEDLAAQFLNSPDILQRLYEILHVGSVMGTG